MSSPFTSSVVVGQPVWTVDLTVAGNFSKVDVSGESSVPEVGYGEGGYGEDGYDTPQQNFPAASTPNWTIETSK